MRSSFLFQVSTLVGGLLLLLLWLADWDAIRLEAASWFDAGVELNAEEPVMVMLVGDPERVAAIRDAVDPDRIVASTPDAFALVEGRIIATSVEAASRPLNQAGWASRSIEIVVPPRKLTPGYAAVQDGGPGSGDPSVAFKDKDVLSQDQSLKLLNAMDQRGF